jgi:hypothetical protein
MDSPAAAVSVHSLLTFVPASHRETDVVLKQAQAGFPCSHQFNRVESIVAHSPGFRLIAVAKSPFASTIPNEYILDTVSGRAIQFPNYQTFRYAFSPDSTLFVCSDEQFSVYRFSAAAIKPTGITRKRDLGPCAYSLCRPLPGEFDSGDDGSDEDGAHPAQDDAIDLAFEPFATNPPLLYAFSSDSRWLARCDACEVWLWELNHPKPDLVRVRHADAPIEAVCFSTDNTTLLCIAGDHLVAYSLATETWLPLDITLLPPPPAPSAAGRALQTWTLAPAPIGQQVAIYTASAGIQLIDLALGTVIAHYDCTVAGLEYSPDGRLLLAGTTVLNAHTLAPLGVLQPEHGTLWACGFHDDGRLLFFVEPEIVHTGQMMPGVGRVRQTAYTIELRPSPAMRAFYAWVLCKQGVPSSEGRVTLPADVAPLIVQHAWYRVKGARPIL